MGGGGALARFRRRVLCLMLRKVNGAALKVRYGRAGSTLWQEPSLRSSLFGPHEAGAMGT